MSIDKMLSYIGMYVCLFTYVFILSCIFIYLRVYLCVYICTSILDAAQIDPEILSFDAYMYG